MQVTEEIERIMTFLKEDESMFELLEEMVAIEIKLESDSSSQIHEVFPVDKSNQLKKQSEELYDKVITAKIELDRIRIRETPRHQAEIDILRKYFCYQPIDKDDFDAFWNDYYEEILETHQDTELIERYAFIRNYFKLTPPYVKVGTNIPEGIKNIYHESRWCFVYGQYSATIALSRTIIEAVLKDKYNIVGNLNEIIETAKNRRVISKQTAWYANKVRLFANKILHQARSGKENEAKDAIEHVRSFLEEIYL